GVIATLTRATCGSRRRTEGSVTPTVTDSTMVFLAPVTATGSVVACDSVFKALPGPTMTTVGGSEVIWPTAKPLAGCPSTSGRIGTVFDSDSSNSIETFDGVTC